MEYFILALFAAVFYYLTAGREGKTKRDVMLYEHKEIEFGKHKKEEISEETIEKGKGKILLLIILVSLWVFFLIYILIIHEPS